MARNNGAGCGGRTHDTQFYAGTQKESKSKIEKNEWMFSAAQVSSLYVCAQI